MSLPASLLARVASRRALRQIRRTTPVVVPTDPAVAELYSTMRSELPLLAPVARDALLRARCPELEMRLHTPVSEVVMVRAGRHCRRVSGTLDEHSVALLRRLLGAVLDRAAHVVLNLGEVAVLRRCGVGLLLDVHRHAITRGAPARHRRRARRGAGSAAGPGRIGGSI